MALRHFIVVTNIYINVAFNSKSSYLIPSDETGINGDADYSATWIPIDHGINSVKIVSNGDIYFFSDGGKIWRVNDNNGQLDHNSKLTLVTQIGKHTFKKIVPSPDDKDLYIIDGDGKQIWSSVNNWEAPLLQNYDTVTKFTDINFKDGKMLINTNLEFMLIRNY